jgi:hypothetical protein
MNAPSTEASKILIARYDGYLSANGNPNSLRYSQLAPNGKIYNSTNHIFGATDVLNVINSPNNLGLACDFRQHQIQLPTFNGALTNYPNFRLGALHGSSCDTLTPTNEVNNTPLGKLRIYPNPANDILKIDLTMRDYHYQGRVAVVLYDILGQEMKRHIVSDFASIVHLDVSKLATGTYILGLEVEGQVVGSERVIVQR